MTTTWTPRTNVSTTWKGRKKPELNIAPLQDAYRTVHDEDNEIIYILVSNGTLVPVTFWTARTPI